MTQGIRKQRLQFPVGPRNLSARLLSLCLAVPASMLALVNLALWVTGTIDAESALYGGLFTMFVGVVAAYRLFGRGSVSLDSRGLVMRGNSQKSEIAWSAIEDARVTTFAETGVRGRFWRRLVRWDENQEFAELVLRRPLGANLGSGYSTERGIPIPGGKKISIFVQDPRAFVSVVKSCLEILSNDQAD